MKKKEGKGMPLFKLDLNADHSYKGSAEQERQNAAQEQERQRAAQEKERQNAAQVQAQQRAAQDTANAAQEKERGNRAGIERLAAYLKVSIETENGKLTWAAASKLMQAEEDRLTRYRARVRELEAFQAQSGAGEAFKKWQASQKQGKTQKPIDWKRYDELKAARVSEKDIARYLRVSANTLRKRVKERKQ